MYELLSLPLDAQTLAEYAHMQELSQELHELSCDGIEAIWGGEDLPADLPEGLAVGYHLTFFPDWLDFWREDKRALAEKFGSLDTVRAFYGGWGAEHLLAQYRADLARAKALGAKYVVFHVSDVSIEEGYTYRWLHESREVIDASAQIINQLLPTQDAGFLFLMENQWWPGLTFTEPRLTERLLDAVRYPGKGLLLDTGHLMNTNLTLSTQAQGAAYIRRMLEAHGELCRYLRGVHLHQSLSGAYVRAHTGKLPQTLPAEYFARFSESYRHILRIDRHEPWTDASVRDLIEQIAPEYLVHELPGRKRAARQEAVLTQRTALHQKI